MPIPADFEFLELVDVEHSAEKPFCWDQTCSCHEDDVLIFEVSLHVQDGLMTPDEATDFVKGKGI